MRDGLQGHARAARAPTLPRTLGGLRRSGLIVPMQTMRRPVQVRHTCDKTREQARTLPLAVCSSLLTSALCACSPQALLESRIHVCVRSHWLDDRELLSTSALHRTVRLARDRRRSSHVAALLIV